MKIIIEVKSRCRVNFLRSSVSVHFQFRRLNSTAARPPYIVHLEFLPVACFEHSSSSRLLFDLFIYFNVSSNLTMRRMIGSSCVRAGKVLFHRTESFIPPRHFPCSSETFEMEATKFFSNGFLPHYPRNNFIGGTRRFSITYNPWSSCRTSPYLFKRINAFVSDVPSKYSSQNSVIFYFPLC